MPESICEHDFPDDVYAKKIFALIPTTIVLFLSLASYGLRIYARKRTGHALGWDDWLMGVGLLIILEPSICQYLCEIEIPQYLL